MQPAITSMLFVEDRIPTHISDLIRKNGGKPIKAMGCILYGKTVYVILSEEPAGPNGEIERHATIYAAYRGVSQWPSVLDIEQACLAAGMPNDSQISKGDGMVVHVRAPVTTEENEKLHWQMVADLFKPGDDIYASLTASKCKLLHAAIGIASEAGELLDAVKKHTIYGKELDVVNVIEELGDLEFYLEALRQTVYVSRAATLDSNMTKLLTGKNARYKEGTYSDKAAQERSDKAVEATESEN